MRDLLNILYGATLTESRGLGARRAGEEFVSTTNPEDKIYVNYVKFYPEGAMTYPSYEAMVAELEQVAKSVPNAHVDLIGKFKQTDLAFGLAVFDQPGGQSLAFIKPFKSVKPDPTQNQWDNQTGIPGYRYNSKSAAKTQAGMTPQDILTQQSDLTPLDIVQQISAKFGENNALTQVAKAIAAGQSLPISVPAPVDMSFTAFRDYFCELLHPIALQTGNYEGNAGEAAEKFLGQGGYSECSINFGTDKTEGLSDSIMIGADGRKIKVSSKGAKGATASAKNLVDAAKELADSNPGLLAKHKEVIELLQDMVKQGQAGAPLVLGVKYGIIDEDDANDIRNFKKLPKLYTINDAVEFMSPRLGKLAKDRQPNDPNNVNVYFHCIAAVAHKAAEHVNKSTNFSKAASEILNNGALVQVYTDAAEGNGRWTLKSFRTVWPSSTVTGVEFSAGKTYYSTGIKGNFTFKILQNGAKSVDDETDDIEAMSAEPVATPNVVTGQPIRGIRPKSAPSTAPEKSVGRERR